jgi:hypothetical protein
MRGHRRYFAFAAMAIALGLAASSASCSLVPAPKVRIRVSDVHKHVETAYYSFGYSPECLEADCGGDAVLYFDGIADDGYVYAQSVVMSLDGTGPRGDEVSFYCNERFDIKEAVPVRAVVRPMLSANYWEIIFVLQDDGSWVASTY